MFSCNSTFCFWGNHQKHFYNGLWLTWVVPWTNWILKDSWKAAHWKQTMRWILTWDLIDSLWGGTLFVVSQREVDHCKSYICLQTCGKCRVSSPWPYQKAKCDQYKYCLSWHLAANFFDLSYLIEDKGSPGAGDDGVEKRRGHVSPFPPLGGRAIRRRWQEDFTFRSSNPSCHHIKGNMVMKIYNALGGQMGLFHNDEKVGESHKKR